MTIYNTLLFGIHHHKLKKNHIKPCNNIFYRIFKSAFNKLHYFCMLSIKCHHLYGNVNDH